MNSYCEICEGKHDGVVHNRNKMREYMRNKRKGCVTYTRSPYKTKYTKI